MLNSAVIGSGGAGRNMLSQLLGSGIPLYLINSTKDSGFESIFSSKAEIRASVSTDPSIKRGLMQTERSAYEVLKSYDVVFSVSGLGGFYGTMSPIMLSRLSDNLIPVFTFPFSIEGGKRMDFAKKGMERILSNSRWALVLENDKLLELVPNATLQGAFRAMNLMISEVINGISRHFSDAHEVLYALSGKVGAGIGTGTGMNRQEKALRDALSSPWLEIGDRALLIMKGGSSDDFIWVRNSIEDMGAEVSAEMHIEGNEGIELIILS